jgi:hypothetical protein
LKSLSARIDADKKNREVLIECLKNDLADFGKHIIPQSIQDRRVNAYIFKGYWEDIGTIRAFFEANLDLTKSSPQYSFFEADAPIYTHPRFLPGSKIDGATLREAIVADLLAISKQAGLIMPGPVQAAMAAALSDDAHATEQRERYADRRSVLLAAFAEAGWAIDHSEGGLYLWATHPAHDCWSAAELLAAEAGILVAPGELYGPAGKRHVRVALTATDERIAAAAARLRELRSGSMG